VAVMTIVIDRGFPRRWLDSKISGRRAFAPSVFDILEIQ